MNRQENDTAHGPRSERPAQGQNQREGRHNVSQHDNHGRVGFFSGIDLVQATLGPVAGQPTRGDVVNELIDVVQGSVVL